MKKSKLIRVRTSTLLDMEKDLKKYAESLINGGTISSLAEGLDSLFKPTKVRNTESIINEYITRAEKELIADGMMSAPAKRISKASIREYAEQVLVAIN